MARRTAIVACLAAAGGHPMTAKGQYLIFKKSPLFLEIDIGANGQQGFSRLIVRNGRRTIVITADEIWEALQPPKEPTR